MAKVFSFGLGAAIVCAALASLPAMGQDEASPPAETLAQRFAKVKHLAIEQDNEFKGYRVYIFSEAQQKQYLEDRRLFAEKMQSFRATHSAIEAKIREAQEAGASSEEINAILGARRESQRNAPRPPMYRSASLYKVKSVGVDFIELQSETDASQSRIIPLRFICDVQIPTRDPSPEDNAGQRNEN
jgi:hypothetical protein